MWLLSTLTFIINIIIILSLNLKQSSWNVMIISQNVFLIESCHLQHICFVMRMRKSSPVWWRNPLYDAQRGVWRMCAESYIRTRVCVWGLIRWEAATRAIPFLYFSFLFLSSCQCCSCLSLSLLLIREDSLSEREAFVSDGDIQILPAAQISVVCVCVCVSTVIKCLIKAISQWMF